MQANFVYESKLNDQMKFVVDNSIRKLKYEDTSITLTLPTISPLFIHIEYSTEIKNINEFEFNIDSKLYPLATSNIIKCDLVSAHSLTTSFAERQTMEVTLKSFECKMPEYEPGDSIGIIVKNRKKEVELLLNLLNLKEKADTLITVSLDPHTTKKEASIPKFIPEVSTFRYILTYCVDIRSVLKKAFLRTLLDFITDVTEKRRVMELISRETAKEYNVWVRDPKLTFIDFLIIFKSCKPPFSVLIEHLPRLLPRIYSITSSQLLMLNTLSFVFNVIDIPLSESVTFKRKGICTGWLETLSKPLLEENQNNYSDISENIKNLILEDKKVFVYFRSNKIFRLPEVINTPLILVGPGTGIAPFIGFLKHRKAQLQITDDSKPFTWLFFGCRNKKYFLYEKELNEFLQDKILTKLSISFSRVDNEDKNCDSSIKYVQDNILKYKNELFSLIHEKDAVIYVCGDARNMTKNIMNAFLTIFKDNLNIDELGAKKYLADLQIKQRYLQDIWG